MKKMIKKYWNVIVSYLKEDSFVFAKGLCFEKLFLIFVIFSIFGTYYEQILNLVTNYFKHGTVIWEYRRGVIYGPFSPIYGMGAVLLAWLLVRKKRPWYETILYGGLIGGGFEYLISFLQETFIGTVSWDYSQHFLNINGRTTLLFMLVWGIMSFLFTDYLYPFLSSLIEKIPYRLGKIATGVLVLFLTLDMLISWTALARQTLRRNQVEPFTVIGELYDKIYPDEVLAKYFPNMVVRD